jgi:hypothetical protein
VDKAPAEGAAEPEADPAALAALVGPVAEGAAECLVELLAAGEQVAAEAGCLAGAED